MRETWVQSLGWKDPLEKEMATHCSILAWKIPWTKGAWWATYTPWGSKEVDTTEQHHFRTKVTPISWPAPGSSFLASMKFNTQGLC